MKCKKCGFENSSDSAFCVNCGSPIEKDNFKKCVVCGSDIGDDVLYCTTCGSKQDDYIKCSVCGEASLKTFKFCTRCGTPFDGSSAPYNKTISIDKNELNENTGTVNFDKVEPVNDKPIINIPDNSFSNTNTMPNKPIVDNTEIFNTLEMDEPKKDGKKIILIIVACVFALALIAVLAILAFKIFFKDDDVVIEHVEKQEVVEVIEENQKQEDNTETKQEVVEVVNKASYFKIRFLDTVKIRTAPSLDGEHIGKVSKGSSMIAFERQSNDGYTWYRISFDEWVADDGSFLSVSDYETDKVDLYTQSGSMVRVSRETSVYDEPSSSANRVGTLSKSTLISIYDTIKTDNSTWYKISPCEYINADDAYFE